MLLGFTIRLRGDTQTAGVRAAMSIGLRSSDARAVVAALRRMPAVARLHSTNGQWDLIAEILAPISPRSTRCWWRSARSARWRTPRLRSFA